MPELQQYEVNVYPSCQESLYVTAEFPPYCRSQSIRQPQPPPIQVASKPIFAHQLGPQPPSSSSRRHHHHNHHHHPSSHKDHYLQQLNAHRISHSQRLTVSGQTSPIVLNGHASGTHVTTGSSSEKQHIVQVASKPISPSKLDGGSGSDEPPASPTNQRVYKTHRNICDELKISDIKLSQLKLSPSSSSAGHGPSFEYRNGIQYELAPVEYIDKTVTPSPRPSPTPAPTLSGERTASGPKKSFVTQVASKPILPGQLAARPTSTPPCITPTPLGPLSAPFGSPALLPGARALSTPPALPFSGAAGLSPFGANFGGLYGPGGLPLRPAVGFSPNFCPPGLSFGQNLAYRATPLPPAARATPLPPAAGPIFGAGRPLATPIAQPLTRCLPTPPPPGLYASPAIPLPPPPPPAIHARAVSPCLPAVGAALPPCPPRFPALPPPPCPPGNNFVFGGFGPISKVATDRGCCNTGRNNNCFNNNNQCPGPVAVRIGRLTQVFGLFRRKRNQVYLGPPYVKGPLALPPC